MKQESFKFYSNGKILLTGEYLILFGARALAFPIKYGQEMLVETQQVNQILAWKAYEPAGLWFNANFSLPDLKIIDTSSMEQAMYLQKLFTQIGKMQPGFFAKHYGLSITTKTEIPVKWGLGTSSSLISNLAGWAEIDVFKFFYAVSKGSGYDIACARSSKPIVFHRNVNGEVFIQPVAFKKSYADKLFLVYAGRKQSSEQHISQFLQRHRGLKNELKKISHITENALFENTIEGFIELMKEHESIIGHVLDETPIQEEIYSNFDGVVKSLGFWGSDFILAATTRDIDYVGKYFESCGLTTILPFNATILN